jgi:threonine/homoserine/homoserine lactone efflux protein
MLVVAGSGLLFSLSPGPSMLYVMSRALGQGRQAGLASALGLAAGGVTLAVLTALASAWVISESNAGFRIIKLLGGLYLLWIGVGLLRTLRHEQLGISTPQNDRSFTWLVRQGFLVEVLNPKTIFFLLAFLPAFVEPERGSIHTQVLVLGVLVPLTAVPADLTVSVAGGWISKRLDERAGIGWAMQLLGGLVIIGLGVRTLLQL